MPKLLLASESQTRIKMLRNAGLEFETAPARIDEPAVKAALLAEGAPPRDIADKLAELKAMRLASKYPQRFVLGCDQVLALEGQILSKAETLDAAKEKLAALSGKAHSLYSAAVIFEGEKPVWRKIGQAQLIMRPLSEAFIEAYVTRNPQAALGAVGCYHIEGEGAQLFTRVQGDLFSIMGMPLLDILGYLRQRGEVST